MLPRELQKSVTSHVMLTGLGCWHAEDYPTGRVSTEFLQIALLDQTLYVSLADVELTVFGEVDGPGNLCKQTVLE